MAAKGLIYLGVCPSQAAVHMCKRLHLRSSNIMLHDTRWSWRNSIELTPNTGEWVKIGNFRPFARQGIRSK